MRRAVLLAGGWAHPGHDQVAAMSELLTELSFDVQVVTEPADAPAVLGHGCELLVVAACWFSMTDDRYTDEQRRHHAVPFSPAFEKSLTQLRADGCPVLALHTAVICFDAHDMWADWLGGTWNWATSWHPEPGPMRVEAAPDAPFAVEPFNVVDELYQDLDLADDVRLVAHTEGHPMVWLRTTENGRAAVNLLGHDSRSLQNPAHRNLNQQLLTWLLHEPTSTA